MRAGDWLFLILAGLGAGLTVYDGVSGGALTGWMQQNLYAAAGPFGAALGQAGTLLSPLLLLPLLLALWGRFAPLPRPAERGLRAGILSIDAINRTIGDAARWLALGLVLVTVTVVIQRYVFGFASTRLQESVIYMHALLFLLSAGSTLLAGGHVRVDILYARLTERGKAWTEIAGTYLALIPMCWVILVTSGPYVNNAWRILERSRESDGLPLVFLLKTAIPLFAVLMLLQGLAMAGRAALTIAGREAPERPMAVTREL
ncbi:MAG: TRAP transporter small permease subunit [Maricaulaceae bacterium]|nr:TRAP transporter small permease subunit [Maricaulaceae bacterium]